MATGSAEPAGDQLISVWNMVTGQLFRELKGHLSDITSLAFSPDGTRLVSGSMDGSIKWWDLGSKQRPFFLGRSGARLQAIAARADGVFVAMVSGSHGKPAMLELWNMTTGQREWTQDASEDFAGSVLFSPDGREIITAGGIIGKKGEIKTWNALSGMLLDSWTTDFTCYGLAINADGTLLASAGGNRFSAGKQQPKNELKIWDRRKGGLLHNLGSGTGETTTTVAFHPDGTRCVSGTRDQFTIWDSISGQPLRTVSAHDGPINHIACSPDGKYIVTGGNDALRIWNAEDGEWIANLDGHQGLIYALAFSPDGARLVSSDNRSSIRIWDLVSHEQLLKLEAPDAAVTSLAFAHDNCLVGGRSDGRIQVWRGANSGAIGSVGGASAAGSSDDVQPQWCLPGVRKSIRRTEASSEIKLWETATGRLLHHLHGLKPGGAPRSFAFDPASTLVAASQESQLGLSEEILIWEIATGQVVHRISDPGHANLLGFSNDGNRLVAWGLGRGANAWDLISGKPVPTQPGDEIQKPDAISPDLRFTAIPIGTRIRLIANQPPSQLETVLRRQWNHPVILNRHLQVQAHQRAGRAYAAWFELDRRLFEMERPTPEDFRLRNLALLAALKQFPEHRMLKRLVAQLLIAHPETIVKPADLIPSLVEALPVETRHRHFFKNWVDCISATARWTMLSPH